ncbi:MAG: type VI secretion system transmembrane protein TssO [Chryseobacterium sp.]|jgi:hypothetical protein|uniref:type VI secretion system transmembrane protein TssO n=1 Tax=Chryseobacterium sp. TaxID=1871047 RepID=UPI00282C83C7|nr:type VI secretion system transmembrane protein TssO [Chryseobacterium sp.]MDR2235537.1 type VI secretion system transmembrane protein TssO [Chryseobacterium sp.]
MQGQITLTKKERHYQFFYLILMLLTAMIFLGVIFLKGFSSPFSDENIIAIQSLEKKNEFEKRQKIIQPLIDSTYNNINKISDKAPEPYMAEEISQGINGIGDYFKDGVTDVRKDAYPQIAEFYKMYYDDKRRLSVTLEDIKKLERDIQDCQIGFKNKQGRLYDRNEQLKSRTQ